MTTPNTVQAIYNRLIFHFGWDKSNSESGFSMIRSLVLGVAIPNATCEPHTTNHHINVFSPIKRNHIENRWDTTPIPFIFLLPFKIHDKFTHTPAPPVKSPHRSHEAAGMKRAATCRTRWQTQRVRAECSPW